MDSINLTISHLRARSAQESLLTARLTKRVAAGLSHYQEPPLIHWQTLVGESNLEQAQILREEESSALPGEHFDESYLEGRAHCGFLSAPHPKAASNATS